MRIGKPITTYTGIAFYPLDPREEEIDTRDIAHALSLICRANGHFRHFYSVAQHSLNCAKEAKRRGYSDRLQLACLLHDASEAYLADVTRPVKQYFSHYLEIEAHLQNFIYQFYGLDDLSTSDHQEIKLIDDFMLEQEMAALFIGGRSDNLILKADHPLAFRMMDEVEEEFMMVDYIMNLATLKKA